MVNHKSLLHRLWHSPYLRQSSFFVGLQMVTQILFSMLQVWALAHYLPRESYGIWGYCGALAGIATIFTLPGMGQVITYGAAQQQDGVLVAAVKVRLTFGLLSSLALLCLAIGHYYAGRQDAAIMLLFAALFLPAQLAFDSVDAFLTGQGNFKTLFWRRIITQGGIALAIWIGAAISGALWVCAFILYGGGLLVSAALFVPLLQQRRNHIMPDNFKQLSQRFSLQSIGSTISYSMERPLLSAFVSFNEIAAYNLAMTAQLAVGFGRVVDRIFVSRLANRQLGISITQVQWGMWVLFVVGALASMVVIMVVRYLLPLILPHYQDAVPLMSIVLLQMPFVWSSSLGISWLIAQPQNHLWYHRIIWGTLLGRILFLTIGALTGGVLGVIWAWVILEGCHFLAVMGISTMLAKSSHCLTGKAANDEHYKSSRQKQS